MHSIISIFTYPFLYFVLFLVVMSLSKEIRSFIANRKIDIPINFSAKSSGDDYHYSYNLERFSRNLSEARNTWALTTMQTKLQFMLYLPNVLLLYLMRKKLPFKLAFFLMRILHRLIFYFATICFILSLSEETMLNLGSADCMAIILITFFYFPGPITFVMFKHPIKFTREKLRINSSSDLNRVLVCEYTLSLTLITTNWLIRTSFDFNSFETVLKALLMSTILFLSYFPCFIFFQVIMFCLVLTKSTFFACLIVLFTLALSLVFAFFVRLDNYGREIFRFRFGGIRLLFYPSIFIFISSPFLFASIELKSSWILLMALGITWLISRLNRGFISRLWQRVGNLIGQIVIISNLFAIGKRNLGNFDSICFIIICFSIGALVWKSWMSSMDSSELIWKCGFCNQKKWNEAESSIMKSYLNCLIYCAQDHSLMPFSLTKDGFRSQFEKVLCLISKRETTMASSGFITENFQIYLEDMFLYLRYQDMYFVDGVLTDVYDKSSSISRGIIERVRNHRWL